MPAGKPYTSWACSRIEGAMEKLFSWKVLVSFCTVFLLSWILLQTVSNMRLEAEAQLIGESLFAWSWPSQSWQSKAEITQASIVRKSDNDAIIKISGKQTISSPEAPGALDNSPTQPQTVDCSATLTLYKESGKWILGRVEL